LQLILVLVGEIVPMQPDYLTSLLLITKLIWR